MSKREQEQVLTLFPPCDFLEMKRLGTALMLFQQRTGCAAVFV